MKITETFPHNLPLEDIRLRADMAFDDYAQEEGVQVHEYTWRAANVAFVRASFDRVDVSAVMTVLPDQIQIDADITGTNPLIANPAYAEGASKAAIMVVAAKIKFYIDLPTL